MYHRMGSTAARLLHVCFRKKGTFGSTFVAHSGTFGHIRAHSGQFGDFRLRARPAKTKVFTFGRQKRWHIRRTHPFFFIILKRGHGARCRRHSRQQASRILHRARVGVPSPTDSPPCQAWRMTTSHVEQRFGFHVGHDSLREILRYLKLSNKPRLGLALLILACVHGLGVTSHRNLRDVGLV